MQTELVIHPERLREIPQVFEGDLDLEEFPRLAESLAEGGASLHYRVTAYLDKQRRKVVSCIIEGFVFLTCQTSLDTFRHEIAINDRLVLVDSEEQLPAIGEESDAEDYLVADGPLDIRDLVEDAVLLALPMVPRKPGLEEAPAAGGEVEHQPSPFAALAGLKRKE